MYIYNTIIGEAEAETGGSVELPGQLYILIRAPSSVRDHSSANETENNSGRCVTASSGFCACAHMYVCTDTRAQTHMRKDRDGQREKLTDP